MSEYYGVIRSDDAHLEHHGIKGQKWGVRRYDYVAKGIYQKHPEGYDYNANRSKLSVSRNFRKGTDPNYRQELKDTPKTKSQINKQKIAKAVITGTAIAGAALAIAGTVYAYKNGKLNPKLAQSINKGKEFIDYNIRNKDMEIAGNVKLSRIQDTKEFVNGRAFFATVEKQDSEMYTGLFGRSLTRRAENSAKKLTKQAAENISDLNLKKQAEEAVNKAKNMKIYQLSFETQSSIKAPSTKNASNIMNDILKNDSSFRADAAKSLENARKSMPRPQQEALLRRAERLIQKDPSKLSDAEKKTIYKGLNLTFTYHNDFDNNVQTKYYSKLKEKGYGALLDINDKYYSSYHAKKPLIMLDDGKVKLDSTSEISRTKISELYNYYNPQRLSKDALYQAGTAHISTAVAKAEQIAANGKASKAAANTISKAKSSISTVEKTANDVDEMRKLFSELSTNNQKGIVDNVKFDTAMNRAESFTNELLKRRRIG